MNRGAGSSRGVGSLVLMAAGGLVFGAACGWQLPRPPESTSAKETPITEALGATLEEHNDSGLLTWRITAGRAVENGGVVECDSVTLSAPSFTGSGSPSTMGSPSAMGSPSTMGSPSAEVAHRGGVPGIEPGLTATAAHGRIVPAENGKGSVVRLDSGFTVRMDNGWTARGEVLIYDGVLVRAPGVVVMERPGMRWVGSDAQIGPKGPRIRMRSVSGVIEGVSL